MLTKKYPSTTRIVGIVLRSYIPNSGELFSSKAGLTRSEALEFFYHSMIYQLMSEGVSDMHCMSDDYLAEELLDEYVSGEKG